MDVSVILPVLNERDNLSVLLPKLASLFDRQGLSFEIIVVDGDSTDGTRETAERLGARVLKERRRGYAGALETGFAEAGADWVLTLDADLSHDPDFITRMWQARERADVVIASRYVAGGIVRTLLIRRITSAILNQVLRRMLRMPVRDLSSGFRLYRRTALEGLKLESHNFEVVEEVLVKLYLRGCSITEVPFSYMPRGSGRSHARLIRFGLDIARGAVKLRKLRKSGLTAK